MKILYFFGVVIVLLFLGYLIFNNFSFDNISFSNFLISSIFVFLMCCVVIGGILAFISYGRKHSQKDMMTIRQYYNYKNAR
ncbi:hypothetical protein GR160_14485 [Flavobacterium sp. Sd200]|uniref:hypothetical protein n=1 Tax=Flavobacterium sp. Sd200 TaxID=2692211 RepID=UPI0013700F82|nr:hypothetical protein [Flavobacterium sp. Sd200]MXN92433.1 hypothetical protein [Flavobacterium sp. Sd200]